MGGAADGYGEDLAAEKAFPLTSGLAPVTPMSDSDLHQGQGLQSGMVNAWKQL